jgi:hypothetical protein
VTVQELIEALQQMPPDASVQIQREGYPVCDDDLEPNKPELDENGNVQL